MWLYLNNNTKWMGFKHLKLPTPHENPNFINGPIVTKLQCPALPSGDPQSPSPVSARWQDWFPQYLKPGTNKMLLLGGLGHIYKYHLHICPSFSDNCSQGTGIQWQTESCEVFVEDIQKVPGNKKALTSSSQVHLIQETNLWTNINKKELFDQV